MFKRLVRDVGVIGLCLFGLAAQAWAGPLDAATVAILALAPIATSGEESVTQLDRRNPAIEVIRRPEICTEQFDPVCGRIGDEYQIYSNACFARAAGARIVNDGSCHFGHHSRPLA